MTVLQVGRSDDEPKPQALVGTLWVSEEGTYLDFVDVVCLQIKFISGLWPKPAHPTSEIT